MPFGLFFVKYIYIYSLKLTAVPDSNWHKKSSNKWTIRGIIIKFERYEGISKNFE